jgi:hypothetical protein
VRYKQTATTFPSVNAVVAVSVSIMSAAELAKIGVDSDYPANGAYSLGADITLNNWTPLKFAGSFNGNGRRITINSFNPVAELGEFGRSYLYVGIFSSITGPSYDTPVVVENFNISVGSNAYTSINGLAPNMVGTIAGRAQYVLLSNIHVDGAAIAFNGNESSSHITTVGGIVGNINASVIKGCSNSASITVEASFVGGIAGVVLANQTSVMEGSLPIQTSSIVDSCYATGSITTSSADSERASVGGIVGNVNSYVTIKRSYYAGSITVSRGNDRASDSSSTAGIGGIAGHAVHGAAIEDCHSSGVFTAISTNTGGYNSGMALGGILGFQWGRDAIIQSCYSTAELNVQRNSKAYVGGIMGLSEITGSTTRITACVALNDGIGVEYASGGVWGLHRVVGAKIGESTHLLVLSRNIAWSSIPLSTTETGQAAQPFTEASADMVRTGVAGEDCDQKPTQSDYTTLGWDFSTVWTMGSDGYPELR